ncbi:acyl-CoA dehydrogenase [Nocardioides marinquilinus]|uniref:Acyl-CoA dehydrogenase n=1 Tax=Nocardioides marinquilinus TaxID=1210400 RepID=A0ABP9PBK1_9ACTN
MTTEPVRLAPGPSADDDLLRLEVGRDVDAALGLATWLGPRVPRPGSGRTRLLWEVLATLGAADLQAARVVEPHLDALAVLAEHGPWPRPPDGSTWGVFAAEGPGVRVEASDGVLRGTKPWCSLADRLSHALVTGWVGEARQLFAVDLRHPTAGAAPGEWAAHGLPGVRSTGVSFDATPATPVGDPGWYLRRDGFAWGGMGVAAVWFGGAVGLARRLRQQADRRPPDDVALLHLGAVDVALHGAGRVLAAAADDVDAGRAAGAAGAVLAQRVRGVVARAAEEVLARVGHALGPGPLAAEADHAARVADLTLYLRQHHAERDDVALGRLLLDGAPW